MLARRLLLLAAVLMLLTALAAGLAPAPDTADPPAGGGSLRAGTVVEERLSAEAGESAGQTVEAQVGDVIRLEVAGDLLDSVQIERLDRFDGIEPSTPARFELLAEEPGVYPIRLVDADRRIGRLDIKP